MSVSNLIRLIERAEAIFRSEADWEIKYDTIFDMFIWRKIRDVGHHFEWCDPDTSYEEDVTAYVTALSEFKERLQKLPEEERRCGMCGAILPDDQPLDQRFCLDRPACPMFEEP
jgi:hypothetical protein